MSHLKKSKEDRLKELGGVLSEGQSAYLTNKARGGSSGRKGTRYEDHFSGYTLARILANEGKAAEPENWPNIYEQVFSFVDDLVVESEEGATYYQLKNVAALTWQGSDHPLELDFELQKKVSDAFGEKETKLVLVTSDENVAKKMCEGMPFAIASYTAIEHFPYYVSLNRLAIEFEPLRAVVSSLARTGSKVTDDEIGYTLSAFVSSFMHGNGSSSVADLLKFAQGISPALVRLFPHQIANLKLKDEFIRVLAEIPNFAYCYNTGFFDWSCSLDSGVLPYNCLDKQFEAFQNRIINARPTSFEDLEDLEDLLL